jgi:hypothetical protein
MKKNHFEQMASAVVSDGVEGRWGPLQIMSMTAAQAIIAKNPLRYSRFEVYDIRRPAKRLWGEILEQFLRSKGTLLCVSEHAFK